MTYEVILYGITILLVALLVLLAVLLGVMLGQQKIDEIKPAEQPKLEVIDEKAKKEAEKRQRNKALLDEAQEEMDKAVRDFISRGGLPK